MFRNTVQKKFRLAFITIGITMLLSACSIPIPLGDLLPALGSNASGQFEISDLAKSGLDLMPLLGGVASLPVVADTTGLSSFQFTSDLDLDGSNEVVDIGSAGFDSLVNLSISHSFLFTKIGDFSGNLEIQPYLAPANASDIYAAGNRFGESITLDLSNTSQVSEATIMLNTNQIMAINDQQIRLGFQLLGDVTNITSDEVGIRYTVQSFKITDLKFNLDQEYNLDSTKGIELLVTDVDQNDRDDFANGLISKFKLQYTATLQQSTPVFIKGVATLELYLQGISQTGNIFNSENFIQSVEIDLAQQPQETVSGELVIDGDLLKSVLDDGKVLYGLKLKGTAIGIEAVPGDESSVVFNYEVTRLNGELGIF